jgi:signal transduction histidine kinase
MLPIAAALVGMLVLGLFQTVQVWRAYQDATDAEVLSELASSAVELLNGGQVEAGTAVQGALFGGLEDGVLEERRAATDTARADFDRASARALERFPSLTSAIGRVHEAIEGMDDARRELDYMLGGNGPTMADQTVLDAFNVYRDVGDNLVRLGNRLPVLVDDSDVSSQIYSVTAALQAGRIAAELRFRLEGDLVMAQMSGAVVVERGRLSEAAYLVGAYDRQLEAFAANATDQALESYARHMETDEVKLAREAIGVYLTGEVPTIAIPEWSAAQGATVAALHTVQREAARTLNGDVQALRDASTRTFLTTLALLLVLSLTAIVSAAMLARRISRRVDNVREATLTAAYDTLPKTVAAVSQAGNPDEVDRLLTSAKRQTLLAVDSRYADELDSLAEAFAAAHHQALRQTANQALLRLDVEAMMKTLARRGQSLIRRQQEVMESLADTSQRHEIPEEWRSVYHLLSRMRRNEENLLLLAGGDPARRYQRPASVETIIRDAVSEIEDAGRVVVEGQAAAYLQTKPAGDVARILAELLDNAAQYSPPNQSVRVATRRNGPEIVISIADDGIGLNPGQQEQINRRLSEPTQLNSELTATMGLLVVSRLAAEHNIGVQLHSTQNKGTLALVRLPASVQAELQEESPRAVTSPSPQSLYAPAPHRHPGLRQWERTPAGSGALVSWCGAGQRRAGTSLPTAMMPSRMRVRHSRRPPMMKNAISDTTAIR